MRVGHAEEAPAAAAVAVAAAVAAAAAGPAAAAGSGAAAAAAAAEGCTWPPGPSAPAPGAAAGAGPPAAQTQLPCHTVQPLQPHNHVSISALHESRPHCPATAAMSKSKGQQRAIALRNPG